MCDYSLEAWKSRDAVVGEELVVRRFGGGSTGFSDMKDMDTAVCMKPGTELAFEQPVRLGERCGEPATTVNGQITLPLIPAETIPHTTAIFRQLPERSDGRRTHRDALEFPDGRIEKLHGMEPWQKVTVLQLPSKPQLKPTLHETVTQSAIADEQNVKLSKLIVEVENYLYRSIEALANRTSAG